MVTRYRLQILGLMAIANVAAAPAFAADAPDTVRRIRIVATGVDRATPNVARVAFTARGEGKSADEATAAVAASMKAVTAALGAIRDARHDVTVGNVFMRQVRDKSCDDGQSYPPRPQLSTGACAITGYVAEIQAMMKLVPATKAGTVAGVITGAGGLNANVNSYELASPSEARKRAMASALAHAKTEADAIAKASGVRLGNILAINNDNDRSGDDIIVTAQRREEGLYPPPPPPPPPPVDIGMTPSPITTNATITVFYAIVE